MSVGQIERELARLRVNEDGTLGARASVLNLIVVTDEESAPDVMRVVCEISERYPSRGILMISDPDEEKANLEIGLSAFCNVRGGAGGSQVCAEQITVHVEGPPAEHLESLAGPLLVPDLPVFLWYPYGAVPDSPECDGMAALADRLVLDSSTVDCESTLRGAANLLQESGVPALGDLNWVTLSPWRSLLADLFAPPERAGELEKIRRMEIAHHESSRCQALLFAGWLSSALGWHPKAAEDTEKGRVFYFDGLSGEVAVELVPATGKASLSQICLFSRDLTFKVSRCGKRAEARSTAMRGEEMLAERTVYLGRADVSALLGEELKLLEQDKVYESALRHAARMLEL